MLQKNPFGRKYDDLALPENTFVSMMSSPEPIADPKSAIVASLENPIASKSLREIAEEKKKAKGDASCCIVISDNTRPVPYRNEDGLLMPIIEVLFSSGFRPEEITLLVATGMHRPMREEELRAMLDPRIYELGIRVVNHEPKNPARNRFIGVTERGTRAYIDTVYLDADLKIATGLVESHFMAGASGGRKAICPGVISEESTYVFHGPALMADPMSRDLVIEGNPVHEESLAVATLAGVDFLVNVTLDHSFRITGVFSGDLEKAHLKAVDFLREGVMVDVHREADIVITHGGFVGINHYQTAKCGVASIGALKEGGYLIVLADCTDGGHVIGSANYRTTLALLKLIGPERFVQLLNSPDWVFLPEQWQVQQWAKVFMKIPQDHMYMYAPQIDHGYYQLLPGEDIGPMMEEGKGEGPAALNDALWTALREIEKKEGKSLSEMEITYLSDGPYAIPCVDRQ